MSSYSYSSYGSSSGDVMASFVLFLIVIILLILYLVAWFLTMQIVCKAAVDKGYPQITGKLWFIGLFGLIFTPGIIVAALPDMKLQKTTDSNEPDPADQLPSL